ncbi:helix-turn-helix domain-containing protein [Mycetocola tolaasinivorans]|uniref:Helix-turn-helix domain-containing protein n=1 Tax=Mycetocola tolaasinivorans TaxID=76635 RepID=A0A3L7A631_9MICO|nr:DJ-1/PfpI family protein [Mycetocola tolaasinivorans]RLP75564.1 helix-turn-helix domain-containing protein [Mycetocola tolaasinivorans]
MAAHSITFLLFDGLKHLDVAGPAEVFAEANRHGAQYELHYVSPDGEPVLTSIGASFPADASPALDARRDTVVIPGGDAVPTSAVPAALTSSLLSLTENASRIATVCTGAFLLASTGLLEGRRVATHWAHAALLQRLHPGITVIPDAIFVTDGRFHTSAGVSSGIDLALALVEADHGPDLARQVAQQLVVYLQRPGGQSQFSTLLGISRGARDGVRLVIDAVVAHPSASHAIADLAAIAGVSPRHLSRLFLGDLGMTPTRFVENVRLDTAKSLLLGGESVTLTAQRAGFQSIETMRRLFVANLGMPPSVYQQRFRSTGADRT